MKRILFNLLPLLFLALSISAQQAPDFTIVTTDNVTRNLYNTLNQGKAVLLDFFYPSCQGCWYYAPIIEQSYQNYGAGTGNIVYWGINGGNEIVDNAAIIAYTQQYGITNPCASGLEGNGKYVDSLYMATYAGVSYPTYAVICPDKSVYWHVNIPPDTNGFDPYFNDSCNVTAITEKTTGPVLRIYPNPACAYFTFTYRGDGKEELEVIIYNAMAQAVVKLQFMEGSPLSRYSVNTEMLPPGVYSVQFYKKGQLWKTHKLEVVK